MKKFICVTSLLFLFVSSQILAQSIHLLRDEINHILSTKKADVGVSILGIEDKDTLSIHGNQHYPMQSVFKFHIAIVVLDEIDKGNLLLSQKVTIRKKDLTPNTISPIKDKYPEGVELTVAEIIRYTVCESDNIGCDVLLRLIGGPAIVNGYFVSHHLNDISIQSNEEEMHKDWNVQFTNWTTPNSAVNLLKAFYDKKILSHDSNDFLMKTMIDTSTGKKRLKGQLPASVTVAHKTGSSGVNGKGLTAAVNDIGIITLPNGKHVVISIFVSNSYEDEDSNEKIISDISKSTYDYFMNKTK